MKLFSGGEVIGEFAGALPKFQVEQWLASNIPDPSAAELKAILSATASSPRQETEQQLRQFVAAHLDNKAARLALARLVVFEQPEEAAALVVAIRLGDELFDAAEDVRTLAHLMQLELENGTPAAGHLAEAQQALASGNMENAIRKIIAATMADKSYLSDLPRLSAIALFRILGSSHELTKKYRRQFDMALY